MTTYIAASEIVELLLDAADRLELEDLSDLADDIRGLTEIFTERAGGAPVEHPK